MDQRINRDVGKTAAAASKAATTSSSINPPVENTIQQSSLRRSSRSSSNKFSGSNFKRRKMEGHPPPPLDPEMMNVWFPHPDTLKRVGINKIPRTNNPNAGFSAKALAAYAAKFAPKVPASIIQKIRQQDALLFPTWYKYDDEMKDQKTRICSAGVSQSWTEQSFGFPWVAVHGVDQICVVIIEVYEDEVPRRSCLPSSDFGPDILMCFQKKVVAEMEAIDQLIDQSLKRGPFVVVSVVRNLGQQGSSSKVSLTPSDADEQQCIKFLVDKLQDASDFSYNETVKTAISAMRCLFCNKLKCSDVMVSVARKSDGRVKLLSWRDSKEMWLLSDTDMAS